MLKITLKSSIWTAIVVLIIISGCSRETNKSDRLTVVTTVYPLFEFAREVGGDKIDVIMMLPPGSEAHTYEPKPSEIVRVSNADIFIYIGAGLEPWADDVIAGNKNPERTDLSANDHIKLLKTDDEKYVDNQKDNREDEQKDEHGEYDPHIWLDFRNDILIVNAIAETLAKKDPQNSQYYYDNAREYEEELEKLDESFSSSFKNCKKNEFITAGHGAYTYLSQRYNITYHSAFGISPDSEPTPKKIKEITDLAVEHGIRYIVFEETVSPRLAEAIAGQSDAQTIVLNPGHTIRKEEINRGVTFISKMEENLVTLKTILECN